jgi:hypothetical protein
VSEVRSTVVTATIFNWLYNAARWTWHDPDGYNFISGPLADITLLGGAYAILRRHNCHVSGCLRVGRLQVPGTPYIVCHKHHPHEKPTAEEVLAAHSRAVSERKAVRASIGSNAGGTASASASASAGPDGPAAV